jgi:hypothetical protein
MLVMCAGEVMRNDDLETAELVIGEIFDRAPPSS